MNTALGDGNVLQTYGLLPGIDYTTYWTYGTPEALSGETVLLSQVGILPRDSSGADLFGNLDDEPRRTVHGTRGRLLITNHLVWECFNSKIALFWQREKDFIQYHLHDRARDRFDTEHFLCHEIKANNKTTIASMKFCCSVTFNEAFVAEELAKKITPLSQVVAAWKADNPQHFIDFQQNGSAEMLDQIMAAADRHIESVQPVDRMIEEHSLVSGSSDSSDDDNAADDERKFTPNTQIPLLQRVSDQDDDVEEHPAKK